MARLSGRLEFDEGRALISEPFAPDQSTARVHEVAARLKAAIEQALIHGPVIAVDPENPSRHVLVVEPRNCGFVSVASADHSLLVVVKPKIKGTNWLGLLALAERWPVIPEAELAAGDHPDIAQILVEAYAHSLEAMFDAKKRGGRGGGGGGGEGLRRWFDEREETLSGRIRGHLLLNRYAIERAQGRSHRAPCRFPVLEFDNLPNRALRWALRICRRLLLDALPGASPHAHDLSCRLDALEIAFEGVAVERLTPGELRPIDRLPASFAHYQPSLRLARMLIERVVLVDDPGKSRALSFVFDMPTLFEEAMGAALGDAWEPQHEHGYGTPSGLRLFKPDFWHRTEPAVIDAKWKYAFAEEASGSRPEDLDAALDLGPRVARVRHADIFQLVTYCHIRGAIAGDGRVARGLLVYPATGGGPIEPWRIVLAPGVPSGTTVEVALMPWPVDFQAGRSIREDARRLNGAVERYLANRQG